MTARRDRCAACRTPPASERDVGRGDFIALLRDTFSYAGLSAEDAAIAAEVAALRHTCTAPTRTAPCRCRSTSPGLLDGTIKSAPNVETHAATLPCCMVMDADNALGLVVGQQAIDAAIGMAKKYGMGAVAVRNSSHFGAAGYYSERAAEAGPDRLGLHQCDRRRSRRPAERGAARHQPDRRGVSAARRRSDRDGHGDQRSVARSRIRAMLALGARRSRRAGRSIRTASRPPIRRVAVKGSVLPIGGPKGYALALMVELLCSALSDGEPGFQVTYENMVKRPSTISQFFFVMNPEGFAGLRTYGKRAAHIADMVKKAKPMDGASPPRLPGARSGGIERKNRRRRPRDVRQSAPCAEDRSPT